MLLNNVSNISIILAAPSPLKSSLILLKNSGIFSNTTVSNWFNTFNNEGMAAAIPCTNVNTILVPEDKSLGNKVSITSGIASTITGNSFSISEPTPPKAVSTLGSIFPAATPTDSMNSFINLSISALS